MNTLLRPHTSKPTPDIIRRYSMRIACFYAFAATATSFVLGNALPLLRAGIETGEAVRLFLIVATLVRIIVGDPACFHQEVDVLHANSWNKSRNCPDCARSHPSLILEALMFAAMFGPLIWASFDLKTGGKNFCISYAAALFANSGFLLYYNNKLELRMPSTNKGLNYIESLKKAVVFWLTNNLFCAAGAMLALAVFGHNSTGDAVAYTLFGLNIIVDLARTRGIYW